MLNALIEFSLKNRFVVLLLAGILVALGVRAAPAACRSTPSPTRRRSRSRSTPSPRSSSPEEVERQITFPVEQALGGLKGLEEVRSVSKFGLSQVVAIFEDGTDIYFARQQINERLGEVAAPRGHRAARRWARSPPGLGEVYHYLLTSQTRLRPDRAPDAPGLGRPAAAPPRAGRRRDQRLGRAREAVRGPGRPDRSSPSTGLTLDDVIRALEENNKNVGGGYVVRAGESSLVQGVGRARTLDEIADDRHHGQRRRADPRPGRGRGRHRPRDPPRRRHRQRQGRGRPGPRLHADGRELARRHDGPRRGHGGRQAGRCPPASTIDGRLRADRPRQPGAQDRRAEPLRGGRPRHRRPVRVPRATSGPG